MREGYALTGEETAALRPTSRELENVRELLGIALRRRVEQRATRECLQRRAGHSGAGCFDAVATHMAPTPGGGERGLCAQCAGTDAEDAA